MQCSKPGLVKSGVKLPSATHAETGVSANRVNKVIPLIRENTGSLVFIAQLLGDYPLPLFVPGCLLPAQQCRVPHMGCTSNFESEPEVGIRSLAAADAFQPVAEVFGTPFFLRFDIQFGIWTPALALRVVSESLVLFVESESRTANLQGCFRAVKHNAPKIHAA